MAEEAAEANALASNVCKSRETVYIIHRTLYHSNCM